jgi:heat shock protein HslJ
MIKAKTKIVALFLSFVLSGCTEKDIPFTMSGGCAVEYPDDHANTYTLIRSWTFIGFQDAGSTSITYPPCSLKESKMTVAFSPDSISFGGKASINSFGGKYALSDNNGLKMNSIIQTLMGGPRELINFEDRYLEALQATTNYQIEYNKLTLFYGQSACKMLFAADNK